MQLAKINAVQIIGGRKVSTAVAMKMPTYISVSIPKITFKILWGAFVLSNAILINPPNRNNNVNEILKDKKSSAVLALKPAPISVL